MHPDRPHEGHGGGEEPESSVCSNEAKAGNGEFANEASKGEVSAVFSRPTSRKALRSSIPVSIAKSCRDSHCSIERRVDRTFARKSEFDFDERRLEGGCFPVVLE